MRLATVIYWNYKSISFFLKYKDLSTKFPGVPSARMHYMSYYILARHDAG